MCGCLQLFLTLQSLLHIQMFYTNHIASLLYSLRSMPLCVVNKQRLVILHNRYSRPDADRQFIVFTPERKDTANIETNRFKLKTQERMTKDTDALGNGVCSECLHRRCVLVHDRIGRLGFGLYLLGVQSTTETRALWFHENSLQSLLRASRCRKTANQATDSNLQACKYAKRQSACAFLLFGQRRLNTVSS